MYDPHEQRENHRRDAATDPKQTGDPRLTPRQKVCRPETQDGDTKAEIQEPFEKTVSKERGLDEQKHPISTKAHAHRPPTGSLKNIPAIVLRIFLIRKCRASQELAYGFETNIMSGIVLTSFAADGSRLRSSSRGPS